MPFNKQSLQALKMRMPKMKLITPKLFLHPSNISTASLT